jgi:hypothetical protein
MIFLQIWADDTPEEEDRPVGGDGGGGGKHLHQLNSSTHVHCMVAAGNHPLRRDIV